MSPSRIPFLLATCLVFSQGVSAATAKATVAGTYATRDELRECLVLDDGLKARLRAMQAATVVHNQDFDASEVEGARLVEMKLKLDRGDKSAILAFNKAVLDHNVHLQQVDDEAAVADVTNKNLSADQAAMDRKCGPLTYRPADMDAVMKERKKAAAAASAAASAP